MIQVITTEVLGFINDLNDFAANLRALDCQRHNGVGMRRLGFIEAALLHGKKDGVHLCTPSRGVDEKSLQDVALNKRFQDEYGAKASV